MSWMAAAVVGGAVIGGVATKKAADKQAQGTTESIDESRRQFDITQANQKPWLDAGTSALAKLAAETDVPLDESKIQMDPGYEFGRRQGQQAIDRQVAAAGGRISGAALKAAAQFGTDYATTGYNTAYARANQARTDRLNRLAALADVGQVATQNVNAAGTNMVNSNNALRVAAGDNAGAAALAQGNIWSNTTNQLAALYNRPRAGGGTTTNNNDYLSAWGVQ